MTESRSKNALSRIALLVSMYFPPEPGGAASAAWNRASILHKIGYKVFVLCGFPSYPTGRVIDPKYNSKFFYVEETDNFTLIRLRLLPIASKGYLRRFILFFNFILLSVIWMFKVSRIIVSLDLVYAITPTLFCTIIGYVYSKVTKSFFIYESTDLWPEQLVAIRTNLFLIINPLGKLLSKVSYILPDMIIVTSELAAKYVTEKYRRNGSVYALPIGVDINKYPMISKGVSRIELIENKIIPESVKSKFIVLYAGTLNKVTKVENLFYAANKLKYQNEILFLIIGEGDEKGKLEKIKANNRLDNLILLAFPPREFVSRIISASDVCVVTLSSEPIYEATIPTKFFDYLACYKPQIGICNGELKNLIDTHNIGLTVHDGETDKLCEAILSLRNSPSLIQLMENNSHAALQRYTLDTLAAKLNVLLEKEKFAS